MGIEGSGLAAGAAAHPTRPLRLLFVGNPASVHLRRWASFFAGRGHSVHVACLREPSATNEDGIVVHGLGSPALASLRLRFLARRLRSDVLHAHYLTHFGWIAAASLFRPYVVTLWGSDILIDTRKSRVARAWAHVALAWAACVTADSPDVAAEAISLGADPRRVHEIQFGVDLDEFRPGQPSENVRARVGTDREVIFFARSLTPLYRADVAIRALAILGGNAVLVASLAGADSRYAEWLLELARMVGVDGRVRLVPPIPHREMEQYYRLARVVVSIPASDATPVSVLEALAVGTPVVASDLTSVRPWLEPLGRERIVPVDDPEATATALRAALNLTPLERAAIAQAGRDVVAARADRDRNMLAMERLYVAMTRR